jgi:hypothetical protein
MKNRGFTNIILVVGLLAVVIVLVFLFHTNSSGLTKLVPIAPAAVVTETSQPEISVADWKTYSGLGISFNYPQQFKVQPYQTYGGGTIPEQHFVNTKDKTILWFRLKDNVNLLTKKPFTDVQDICGCNRAGKLVTLDNQPASNFGDTTVLFLSPDKEKQYDFQIDGPDISTNIEIFKRILSTFKFTK